MDHKMQNHRKISGQSLPPKKKIFHLRQNSDDDDEDADDQARHSLSLSLSLSLSSYA